MKIYSIARSLALAIGIPLLVSLASHAASAATTTFVEQVEFKRVGNELIITGTVRDDDVQYILTTDRTKIRFYYSISTGQNPSQDQPIRFAGEYPAPRSVADGGILKIRFFGDAGNDTFRDRERPFDRNTELVVGPNAIEIPPMELFGGKGNDTLHGSGYDDILAGGDGTDRLHSNNGQDILIGGLGRDFYHGQNELDIEEVDAADSGSDGISGRRFPIGFDPVVPNKHKIPDELYGDWDGDGTIDRGYFIQSLGLFWLPNHVESTATAFGLPGDWAVVGNWQGKKSPSSNNQLGYDSPGVFRWTTGLFHLDVDAPGYQGHTHLETGIPFGLFGDQPVVGDFHNEGHDRIGVFRAGRFRLDIGNDGFPPLGEAPDELEEPGIAFGGLANTNEIPVVGDWNNDGHADVGVYRTGTSALGMGWWYVDDVNRGWHSNDWVNETFGIPFGLALEKPVVWDFDKNGADDLATVSDEGRWRVWVAGQ